MRHLSCLCSRLWSKHWHLCSVFVEVALSRDQQVMTINCSSRTSSEVLVIDLTTSHLEPFLVLPRQLDLLYYVEHWRRLLIILANTGPGQEYQVKFIQHICEHTAAYIHTDVYMQDYYLLLSNTGKKGRKMLSSHLGKFYCNHARHVIKT